MKTFIFINGRYQESLSNPGLLASYVNADTTSFRLHLPKKFRSAEPIYFVHVNKDRGSQPLQQDVIADEACEVMIVETYQGRSELDYVTEVQTNVALKTNAKLHYYKLQQESDQAVHRATFTANQARDSYLATYHVVRGAVSSEDCFSYTLQGQGTTCESIGFYEAKHNQCLKIDSRIQHAASCSNSRQLYKGMANHQSQVAFSGRVIVDSDLQEICAHQRNNNLLLSSQAQADTKPELEIYSEDVRCSHGATVGQLDETALFYLRSRGIEKESAKALLAIGFASEIFDAFPSQDMAKLMRGEA